MWSILTFVKIHAKKYMVKFDNKFVIALYVENKKGDIFQQNTSGKDNIDVVCRNETSMETILKVSKNKETV